MSAPSLTGGVKLTSAVALPRTALTSVGAPGRLAGVTASLAADSGESPLALVAWTVNVYEMPLVRPVTTHGLPGQVAVRPLGLEVTVYDVIEEPPSLPGAVKDTPAWWSPGVAEEPIGAPGTASPSNVSVTDP